MQRFQGASRRESFDSSFLCREFKSLYGYLSYKVLCVLCLRIWSEREALSAFFQLF
jgi:hypothetical protein